jgi:nucleoside-diphosphate-sugar epimerase
LKKKILITGAQGLIGSVLLEKIVEENNFQIFSIIQPSSQLKFNDVVYLEHDLLNPLPEKKIPNDLDYVIHMAAIAHGENMGSIMFKNCLMTKNLIDAVKHLNPVFIFFSSISVYGEANRTFPIKNTTICKPSSYYGKGKLIDENNIKTNFKDYKILRLCPMVDDINNKDFLKRVFLPKFKIKYKSPYERIYSFSSHSSIFNNVNQLLNSVNSDPITINLKDEVDLNEKNILSNFDGSSFKFPKLILDIIFIFLNFFSFNSYIYHINCSFWKMFRINTYE